MALTNDAKYRKPKPNHGISPTQNSKADTTMLGFSGGKDEAMEDISFPDSTRNVFLLIFSFVYC